MCILPLQHISKSASHPQGKGLVATHGHQLPYGTAQDRGHHWRWMPLQAESWHGPPHTKPGMLPTDWKFRQGILVDPGVLCVCLCCWSCYKCVHVSSDLSDKEYRGEIRSHMQKQNCWMFLSLLLMPQDKHLSRMTFFPRTEEFAWRCSCWHGVHAPPWHTQICGQVHSMACLELSILANPYLNVGATERGRRQGLILGERDPWFSPCHSWGLKASCFSYPGSGCENMRWGGIGDASGAPFREDMIKTVCN